MTTTDLHTSDLLSAGDLVDRLTGASLDELRVLQGRLEDTSRVVRAIIRERQAIGRRDASWTARQQTAGPSGPL